MNTQPILTSERLLLRPFVLDDVNELQSLINDSDVASTCGIPHPYTRMMANRWISSQRMEYEKGITGFVDSQAVWRV